MVAQEKDRTVVADEALGYPIIVAPGVVGCMNEFLLSRSYRDVVVLCDANPAVRTIAQRLVRRLRPQARLLAFALGERRKRLSTLEVVLDGLTTVGAERTTLLIGVGGGVASDLFGFAAATYMRGTAYAHVATSLVAMVDAAIGGKTGVDLAGGKNLVGAFRDPVAVFCDLDALQTLPYRHLREGLAEIVKAAIIEGGDLFEGLETLAAHPFYRWPWESIVVDAIRIKAAIVRDDRLEAGDRELLNLGHTFAHAIECAGGYRMSHGAAVAVGLRAAGMLALRLGRFSEEEHLRVLALLALLGLPMHAALDVDATLAAMGADKKVREGRLRFVLPRAIGDVEHGIVARRATVRNVLERVRLRPGATG
ncbi:MAG: 3-dehydroquinate synthase [Vulcanimicrobiaceae bacterium]